MIVKKIITACAAYVLLHLGSAAAVGTLIPAANRVDMVHDAVRSIIYISDTGNVLRYHIPSATFLAPIVLGGQLSGIDLSPDGATLAVASRTSSATEQWVTLVRLSDLTISKASVSKESGEDGTWAVAFAADGSLFATSRFAGSGWVPMRRLSLPGMTWSKLGTSYPSNAFTQNSMVSASGDGKVISFAEANNSSGPWGLTNLVTGQLVRRQGYTDGTSAYNYEIATNVNGSQFALPTYSGTRIYNSAYTKIATIGTSAGAPIGVAYHPVEPIIYFPWSGSRELRAYSAISLAQVGSYDFEDTFRATGNWAFSQGRTRLSRDGSLLMASVTGGVRFLPMYTPLAAAAVTGMTKSNTAVTLGLKGSIGNAGQISYGITVNPLHGSATINGNYVIYTPAAGFVGTEVFKYAAKYGSATAESTVTVSVAASNHAPVAVNDVAETIVNMGIIIPVLDNDVDADGDPLTITMATQADYGTTAIQYGQIFFTPANNFSGTTTFTYWISDSKGGSSSAQVTVSVIGAAR